MLVALALPLLALGQDAGVAESRGLWPLLAAPPPWVQYASIVAILAHPEEFDGRIVRLSGYASLDPGQRAIWFMPSDYENRIVANSIGIEKLVSQSLRENGYAEMIGIFHAARSPEEPRAGTITPLYLRPWWLAKAAQPRPPPKRRCSLWF
jgi:hypothetical protein